MRAKSDVELLSAKDFVRWKEFLVSLGAHDVYHLPEYHAVACVGQPGSYFLLAYREGERRAALPFLLRPVDNLPWGPQGVDATSVYGYPGPLLSETARADVDFHGRFREATHAALKSVGAVSFFVRLHPILSPPLLLDEPYQLVDAGPTVALDLRMTEAEQHAQMRKTHRHELRRAQAAGVQVSEDSELQEMDSFIRLYEATMQRVGAGRFYFFPRAYYTQLLEKLRGTILLVTAGLDGELIGAALFFTTGKIIQYHLSASLPGRATFSPARVILDFVRTWGKQRGFEWLHLGGGKGSLEDDLFRFKAGFSQIRFRYQTARLIVQPERYSDLCQIRSDWLEARGVETGPTAFFPLYRAIPRDLSPSESLVP